MAKYKISFKNSKNIKITRNVPTKGEMASYGQHFDKTNVEYEAQEYKKDKETNRCGWHSFHASNYCQICGRALSNPLSISRGIGPECYKKHRIPDRAVENDIHTYVLNGITAKKVIEAIPEFRRNECRFCEGELDHTIHYYEHDGGWFVEELNNTVWLWIECIKCGHQWSLQHLGVPRNIKF